MFTSPRSAGAAPLTAGLALVPGGGTTHVPVGDIVLSASTAIAIPAWGADEDPGSTTVRLTTTPGPPVASTATEYVSPRGMRVCALVAKAHVVPGATVSVSGANGPGRQAQAHGDGFGGTPGIEDVDLRGAARGLLGLGNGPGRLGACRARHQGEAGGGAGEHLHLGRHDAPGPGGDDGAHRGHVLHLGRDVLHLDLAGLQHDPLVVDGMDGARRAS